MDDKMQEFVATSVAQWNAPDGIGAQVRGIVAGTGLSLTEALLWGLWSQSRDQFASYQEHEKECLGTNDLAKKVMRRALDATGDEPWKE